MLASCHARLQPVEDDDRLHRAAAAALAEPHAPSARHGRHTHPVHGSSQCTGRPPRLGKLSNCCTCTRQGCVQVCPPSLHPAAAPQRMYRCRKRLWKSLRMVSFTKRFCALGSDRAWFLNTTSSSHLQAWPGQGQDSRSMGCGACSCTRLAMGATPAWCRQTGKLHKGTCYVCARHAV